MLNLSRSRLPVWEKFNSNVAAKCESVSKSRDLKEKFITQIKAGRYA